MLFCIKISHKVLAHFLTYKIDIQMKQLSQDELYMQRCLEIATRGQGKVSPNPMVGCVIVHQGKIIGEGWHQEYGQAHAEVNAIQSVENKALLPQSTVYVNLEPCAHFGNTPPCADLLIKHQVKKVVISNTDPHPQVAGKGIDKLKAQNISVEIGVLAKEGLKLNRRFFTFFTKKRPYIILKWAETADGYIARENFDSKWISKPLSRMKVHQWRSQEDAILVGKNTALYDDPQLNVRDWIGRNPTRIVIDHYQKLSNELKLFDQKTLTICYNFLENKSLPKLEMVKISESNPYIALLQDLQQRKIQSLIVEGGAQTLKAFIKENLWDEARIFKSKNTFGKGLAAPHIHGKLTKQEQIMEDDYFEYQNHQAFEGLA